MRRQGRCAGVFPNALVLACGLTVTANAYAVDAGAKTPPDASAPATASVQVDEPHWVFDPAYPGDDLPPQGRSLFDFLVTEQRGGKPVEVVPYPFASLSRRIDSQTRPGRGLSGSNSVLIPLGRSLQRIAAAPEFFAYPRAVVAAGGEPMKSSGIFLKDRLYLGYQEKADVLEVISYNEAAGRFEFQVVTDYRAGGTPRVSYANRALCTACHQNAAPIFSRQVWDETNANPRVAALLMAQHKDFYGIPVERGVDVPNAIDNATLRANRFAVDQHLWTEGCGGSDERAVRCRAALFIAVLQYRLSGSQQFDRAATSYRDEAAAHLTRVSGRSWPGGLAIGDPDLPNRNPLSGAWPLSNAAVVRDWTDLANVAAAFDPLRLRSPLEIWHVADEKDVARLVADLAEFIAEPDIDLLDRALLGRGGATGSARLTYRSSCQVQPPAGKEHSQRIEFRCAPSPGESTGGVTTEGRLLMTGDSLAGGTIDRLDIGSQPSLRDIDLALGHITSRGTQRVAVLAPMRGGMRLRGADGNALERIEISWGRQEGTISLVAVDDFALVRNAIARLVRDNLDGKFDGFASTAFRRARLMPALLAGLGVATDAWCCLDATNLAPPVTAPRLTTAAAAHVGFDRYCGQCHLSAERAPPNFLAGDADAVEAKLKHCAPRIFVRLSMWRRATSARAKTPMPPEVALHRLELTTNAWRDGEALADLIKSVTDRLRAETGSTPEVDALLQGGYESLRACLPDVASPGLNDRKSASDTVESNPAAGR